MYSSNVEDFMYRTSIPIWVDPHSIVRRDGSDVEFNSSHISLMSPFWLLCKLMSFCAHAFVNGGELWDAIINYTNSCILFTVFYK